MTLALETQLETLAKRMNLPKNHFFKLAEKLEENLPFVEKKLLQEKPYWLSPEILKETPELKTWEDNSIYAIFSHENQRLLVGIQEGKPTVEIRAHRGKIDHYQSEMSVKYSPSFSQISS